MPIRYDVDVGGEWLIPFARKKLGQLKEQARDLGIEYALQRRSFQIDEATRVEVSTVAGLDRITVRAGSAIAFGVLKPAVEYTNAGSEVIGHRVQLVSKYEKTASQTIKAPYAEMPTGNQGAGQIFIVAKDKVSTVVLRLKNLSGALNFNAGFVEDAKARRVRGAVVTRLKLFNDGNNWGTNGVLIPGSEAAPKYALGPYGWNYDVSRFVFYGDNAQAAGGFRTFFDIEDDGASIRHEILSPVSPDLVASPLAEIAVSPAAKYAAFFRETDDGGVHGYYVGVINLNTGAVTYAQLGSYSYTSAVSNTWLGTQVALPQITVTDTGTCWVSAIATEYALNAGITKKHLLVFRDTAKIYSREVEAAAEVMLGRGRDVLANAFRIPLSGGIDAKQSWVDTSADGTVFVCSFVGRFPADATVTFFRVVARGSSVVAHESLSAEPTFTNIVAIKELAMPHPDSTVDEAYFITNRSRLSVVARGALYVYTQVVQPAANNNFDPSTGHHRTGLLELSASCWRNYDCRSEISIFDLSSGSLAPGATLTEYRLRKDPKPLLESGVEDPDAPDGWSFRKFSQVTSGGRAYYPLWPTDATSTTWARAQPFGIYPQISP